jgi:hypothetical protein
LWITEAELTELVTELAEAKYLLEVDWPQKVQALAERIDKLERGAWHVVAEERLQRIEQLEHERDKADADCERVMQKCDQLKLTLETYEQAHLAEAQANDRLRQEATEKQKDDFIRAEGGLGKNWKGGIIRDSEVRAVYDWELDEEGGK